MTTANLAVVFAPNLLWNSKDTGAHDIGEAADDHPVATRLLTLLLDEYPLLFAGVPAPSLCVSWAWTTCVRLSEHSHGGGGCMCLCLSRSLCVCTLSVCVCVYVCVGSRPPVTMVAAGDAPGAAASAAAATAAAEAAAAVAPADRKWPRTAFFDAVAAGDVGAAAQLLARLEITIDYCVDDDGNTGLMHAVTLRYN
jgi:hypothetical protein